MDSEVITSKTVSQKSKQTLKLKTLKGRLLLSDEEKEKMNLMFEQSRWYYNFLVSAVKQKYPNLKNLKSVSYYKIRDLLHQYDYKEDSDNKRYFCEREDKENKEQLYPEWWEKPHTRLPRGVAKKLSQNINSCLSNYHNKNISDFEIHFRSKKKSNTEFILFEDCSFPSFIKNVKSQYWYTDRNGRKQRDTLKSLIENTKPKGIEIIYDKVKNHYYFCYPVDYTFYPERDRRNESQVNFISSHDGKRIISLDPGIRKFLVGYDPDGIISIIGKHASKEIIPLLYSVDKKKDCKLWRKIKNKIEEMHWKTISYLTGNYDIIVIPEFQISSMVRGKKLSGMTKRLLYMFSFHRFLEKLKFKCENTNTKLYIVTEEYTSKTCTCCGVINNVGSSEIYKCKECKSVIDRDVNASRNILIKNLKPCLR